MSSQITTRTVRDFVGSVSDRHYTMSGVVIAASAAQAVALGEACLQISFDHQVDSLDWQEITARIEKLISLKNSLLEWADQEAQATGQQHNVDSGQQIPLALYDSPAQIAQLSITAIEILQEFRTLALSDLVDDLEIAIHLLKSTARAALDLLKSNLKRGADEAVVAKYGPLATELSSQIGGWLKTSGS